MFTSDTGQMAQLGQLGQHASLGLALQQLPSKGSSQTTAQPFPLLYGPGGATTAMFLPSGSVTQHQLHLQSAAATAAHINNVAAAVQSQVRLISSYTWFTSRSELQITYWLKEFRNILRNFIAFFSAIELAMDCYNHRRKSGQFC